MKFKIAETTYDFDQDVLTVAEARIIKKQTGYGLASFGRGMQDGDPDAIVAMMFITYRRNGIACKWADFDEFNLAAIEMFDDDDEAGDSEGEGEGGEAGGDPTPPTPVTPAALPGTVPGEAVPVSAATPVAPDPQLSTLPESAPAVAPNASA